MRFSLFCVLLGIYLLVYINRPDAIDGDATLAVAVSFVQHGTPDIAALGASEGLLPGLSRMGSFGMDGHLYSKKGVTPSLFLLPFVLVAQAAPWLSIRATAMLFNPLVTALTAVVLYSFLLDTKFSARTAWLTALLYGIATFAISYTRTLFGEPLAALLILMAVWQLWRKNFLFAGAALALCIGINLSYAVLVAMGGVYVLVAAYLNARTHQVSPIQRADRLHVASFFAPVILFGLFLLAYNALRFGNPLTSGYNFAQGEAFNYPAQWGIFGLWLSPYRGIVWYNPILLLTLPGMWLWWRSYSDPIWRSLSVLMGLFIIAQTLVYAAWWSWHGGIVWGARFLIPVLPLLVLFIAPVLENLIRSDQFVATDTKSTVSVGARYVAHASRSTIWLFRGMALGLVLLSLLIQVVGSVYDYQHYVGYLYQNYASGRVEGLVSGLSDEVLLNPALSPILGHLNRLVSGANFDTALTTNGINGVHLLAALAILGVGVFQWFSGSAFQPSQGAAPYHREGNDPTPSPSPYHRERNETPPRHVWREGRGVRSDLEREGGEDKIQLFKRLFSFLIVILALNIIVTQQQTAPNHLPVEYATLHPINTLVVADAAIGNALLDSENGTRIISMNSPTKPEDVLAAGLWQVARQSGGYMWLVTWLPRLHPENWQERELWTRYAFVRESPFLDKRAVLFDLHPPVEAAQTGGWQFGAMQLVQYGMVVTSDAVRVTFAWSTATAIPQDYGWFVHLVDANGQIVAQQDRPPQGGYKPTTSWKMGETITDYLTFALAEDTDTTGWFLRIGWLDPNTGERLPLTMPENTLGSNEDNALLLALPNR